MNNYSKFLTTPSVICPSPKMYVSQAVSTFGMVHFTTGYYLFEVIVSLSINVNRILFEDIFYFCKGQHCFIFSRIGQNSVCQNFSYDYYERIKEKSELSFKIYLLLLNFVDFWFIICVNMCSSQKCN